MTTETKYCVYLHGWTEGYRDCGIGDGITQPSRLLMATCDTEQEAIDLRQQFDAEMKRQIPALIPGSGKRRPLFDVGEFEPLVFVPWQNRDQVDDVDALAEQLEAETKVRRLNLGLAG